MANPVIGTRIQQGLRPAGRIAAALAVLAATIAIAALGGCGGPSAPAAGSGAGSQSDHASARPGSRPVPPGQTQTSRNLPGQPFGDAEPTATPAGAGRGDRDIAPSDDGPGDSGGEHHAEGEGPRSLGDLLEQPTVVSRLPVDEAKAAAAGIRKVEGEHLTLYTDLPLDAEIEALPRAFDLAVPQWCRYFEFDPANVDGWKMTGFVMGDKARFQRVGLLPDYLPDFKNGFCHGMELWLYEQPSAYYRRHLLLHEGTHAFMAQMLGATGPPWYAEGMAELLATHRWDGHKLELNYLPADKTETPEWGRIKIIRDGFEARNALSLDNVMSYGPRAHLEVEPYGWCWGAAAMFDGTTAFRPAFRAMRNHVNEPPDVFNRRLRSALGAKWRDAVEQWQLFVTEAEYDYDFERALPIRTEARPLPGETTVRVAADQGWQSSGLLVESGRSYRLVASGRYQVGDKPKPWWCEPGGVTIKYYRGRPLGMLLCAVRDDEDLSPGTSPLIFPQPVGVGRDISFSSGGTLYFRINESPAALDDNRGELSVRVGLTP